MQGAFKLYSSEIPAEGYRIYMERVGITITAQSETASIRCIF